jgi:hypothetical protein
LIIKIILGAAKREPKPVVRGLPTPQESSCIHFPHGPPVSIGPAGLDAVRHVSCVAWINHPLRHRRNGRACHDALHSSTQPGSPFCGCGAHRCARRNVAPPLVAMRAPSACETPLPQIQYIDFCQINGRRG